MNFLKSFFVLAIILFLSSCGDDTCMQSDWVGTYNGTSLGGCLGLPEESAVITVTAPVVDSEIDFLIVTESGAEIAFDQSFTFDGCQVTETVDDGSQMLILEATLNENNISIVFGDGVNNCVWSGIR